MQYEEFKKSAIGYYKALPDETNDLYKKYSVALPLYDGQADAEEGNEDGIGDLVASVNKNTRLNFDVIVSGSHISNRHSGVTVKNPEELEKDVLENKMYKSEENKFAAFVNAHAKRFVFIDVKPGSKERINMLLVNDSHLPVEIITDVGESARLDLFEMYLSNAKSDSLVSPLHEIRVGKGAHAEVNMLHNENDRTNLLTLFKGEVKDDARLRVNTIHSGAGITKSVNNIIANGTSSALDVTEFVYGAKEQKFDLHTYVSNSKERSSAKLESGAVLDGNALCIMKGFAKVEKYTKGAKSRVTERGILLSQTAHIDALPDMSIDYSDQVSATHSAATSPIDREALFYLTSRGIDDVAARKLFVASFISKYMSAIENPIVKEIASSIMLGRLDDEEFGVLKEVTPRGIWLTNRSA